MFKIVKKRYFIPSILSVFLLIGVSFKDDFFEISKQILSNNDLEFQERNSVDSMYQNFGAYQIFVNKEDEEKAKQLLNNEGE